MFWIIFGTASFTTLIVSWAMTVLYSKGAEKAREFATKNGFCYTCGAPLMVKFRKVKKQPIGFNRPIGFKKVEK